MTLLTCGYSLIGQSESLIHPSDQLIRHSADVVGLPRVQVLRVQVTVS